MSEETKRRYFPFPKTLGNCIEPLTRPLFKAQGSAAIRLMTQWDNIAGVELARHSRVEKLSFPQGKKTGGTLTVAIENGFATELQYAQPAILDRLADYFGYRAIARIAISHSFSAAGNPPAPKAKTKPPLPPDCTRMAEDVGDDELRQALRSLAKTLSDERT